MTTQPVEAQETHDGSTATMDTSALLFERLDRIDRTLARLEHLADLVPPLVATAVDSFDESCRRANARGLDIEQRLGLLLRLTERLSSPGTVEGLELLLDQLPQLADLGKKLEQMPGFLAMLGDIFDEWAAKLAGQGIDIEMALRQGIHAALWLGQRISETELDRLGILIRSDVLDPHALAVVGKTGRALATCHEGVCDHKAPDRLGPIGLLRALGDPDVQRSLAFAIQAARCFGANLSEPADIPQTPHPDTKPRT